MDASAIDLDSEDREEGEIVDEDGFEDISDNSISNIESCSTGKLVSKCERLRALSLSSVSTVSDKDVKAVASVPRKSKHKSSRKKKRSKSERRKSYLRRRSSHHSSDSDDERPANSSKLKKQLKEAVHIKTYEDVEVHHNSLRTRLKAMVKLEDGSENSSANEPVDAIIIQSSGSSAENGKDDHVNNEDMDPELRQLRLEALKTAILNKHKYRKKRKAQEGNVLSDSSQKSDFSENKENACLMNKGDNVENPPKKPRLDTGNTQGFVKDDVLSPTDEDTDALRALLLASITKNSKEKACSKADEIKVQNTVIEIKTVTDDNKNPSSLNVEVKKAVSVSAKTTNVIINKTKPSEVNKYKVVNKTKIVARSQKTVQPSVPQAPWMVPKNNKVLNNKPFPPKTASNNLFKQNKFPQSKTVPLPIVKPLIIKLDDSDSDESIFDGSGSREEDNPSDKVNTDAPSVAVKESVDIVKGVKDVESSVEIFLKHERAKVEAQLASEQEKPKDNLERSEKSTVEKKLEGKPASCCMPLTSKGDIKVTEKVACGRKVDIPVNKIVTVNAPKSKPEIVGTEKSVSVKQVQIALESVVTPPNSKEKSDLGGNSLVKLLSKDKQLEYRKLMQRIRQKTQNNNKKPVRIRKITQRTVETKVSPIQLKKVTKNKIVNSKIAMQTRKQEAELNKSRFNKAVKEMTFLDNGRLQIKGKYQSLTPLMKQIDESSREKKILELKIEKLLRELSDVRNKFEKCHEKHTCLTRELIAKKDLIDSRSLINDQKILRSSTPVKEKINLDTKVDSPLNMSPIPQEVKTTLFNKNIQNEIKNNHLKENRTTSTKNVSKEKANGQVGVENATKEKANVIKENVSIPTEAVVVNIGGKRKRENIGTSEHERLTEVDQNKEKCNVQSKNEDMACEEDLRVKMMTNVATKNDISEISCCDPEEMKPQEKKNPVESIFAQYISPLGNQSRCDEVNPMAVFCPYEVNGKCRDPECKYAHFSKS